MSAEVSLWDIAKPAFAGTLGIWLFGKQRPLVLIAWLLGATVPFALCGITWLVVHAAMLAVNIIRWSLHQPYV